MGTIVQMDKDAGDTRTEWDPNNPAEVEAARATFDTLKGKGYVAYRESADGEREGVVHRFDPEARRLILAPPMAGG